MISFETNPQTDADVRRLMTVFTDLLPDGRLVPHEDIEAALGMLRSEARYKTVVNKWRKTLQDERCVYLDGLSAQGRGFVSLTPDDMVRFSNRSVRAAGRKLKRALAVAMLPDDAVLSEGTRFYRQRFVSTMETVIKENAAALRLISRPIPPLPQLPRMVPQG